MKHTAALLAFLSLSGLAFGELRATALLPNRWMPQGEMRLMAEPDETRVEVVLHTRFLDRVLRAIAEKETENWGTHNADAQRYLAALADARQRVKSVPHEGAHESLLIEFVEASTGGVVRLSAARVTATDGQPRFRVESPTLLTAFAPTPEYLRRNMAMILADRLDISVEAAEQRLRRATP